MNRPRKIKILCIDDDTNTSDWIRIVLRGAKIQCTVVTVANGFDAIRHLNGGGFNLCILEYALEDMTGVHLCALIRRLGMDVPIMFFTALSRQIDRSRAFAAGANEYLCKPDDLNIFPDAVLGLTTRKRTTYPEHLSFSTLARVAQSMADR